MWNLSYVLIINLGRKTHQKVLLRCRCSIPAILDVNREFPSLSVGLITACQGASERPRSSVYVHMFLQVLLKLEGLMALRAPILLFVIVRF